MSWCLAAAFLACSFCATLEGLSETLTLQASADTSLWELDPTFNFGGESELVAGTLGPFGDQARSRLLWRFDIATALPANAIIESAQLQFTVVRTPTGAQSSTFALHRVLQLWNEGSNTGELPGGAPASDDGATWRTAGSSDWSIPGGALGTDFAAEASGSVAVVGNGTYTINFTESGLADLESIRANASASHGWVLISQSEDTPKTARRIAAKENSSGAPSLEITYTIPSPAEIPVLEQRFDREAEEVVITVSTELGTTYVLERVVSPAAQSWTPLTEVTGNASGTLEMRGSTAGLNAAFFRVTVTPPVP